MADCNPNLILLDKYDPFSNLVLIKFPLNNFPIHFKISLKKAKNKC